MTLVQVASDDFNRANGVVGSNWTSSPDEGYDLTILSNALKGQGGDAAGFWNANSFTNEQYAQVTIVSKIGSYSGIILRANASDYVIGQCLGSTDVGIYWYHGAAYTQIARVAATVNDGDVLRLEAEGSAFRLYVNNVLRVSGSNASAPSSGAAGVLSSTTDVIDSWSGGNIVNTGKGFFGLMS